MKHTLRALPAVLLLGSLAVVALALAAVAARAAVAALGLVVPGLTGWVALVVAAVGVVGLVGGAVVLGRRSRGSLPPTTGVSLGRSDQSRLWQEVEGLSGRFAARRPDEIRLVADVGVEMHDHASWLGLWPGHRELRIGAPLVLGLTAAQLRALVAHEIGHYSRRFGALPEIVYRGREAVLRLAAEPGRGRIVGAVMPPVARVYDALTRPLVVEQEALSDELTAQLCGRDALLAALERLPALRAAWDGFLRIYVTPGHAAGLRPDRLHVGFEHFLADPVRRAQMAALGAQQEGRVAAEADATLEGAPHPVPADRVARLRALPHPGPIDQRLPGSILVDDLVGVLADLEEVLYRDSDLRPTAWDQLAHRSLVDAIDRGADQLVTAVLRSGHPAPTLGDLLGAAGAHRAGDLVAALVPAPTGPADRVGLAGHLLGDVVAQGLVAAGARFRHSWDRQAALVAPGGQTLDPWAAATAVARSGQGADDLAAWLAGQGVALHTPLTPATTVVPAPRGSVVAAAGPVTGDVPGVLVLTGSGLLLRRRRRGDQRASDGPGIAAVLDHVASLPENELVADQHTQAIPWSEIAAASYVPAPRGRSALVVRLAQRRSLTITFGPETEEYGDLPSALVAFLGPRFVAG